MKKKKIQTLKLFICLKRFAFNRTWITWIKYCITMVSYAILINGIPYGNISLSREVRQGDPLSPCLFILCVEPFIRHLNKLTLNTSSHIGLLCSNHGIKVSNLYFADECFLFGISGKYWGIPNIVKWKDLSNTQELLNKVN